MSFFHDLQLYNGGPVAVLPMMQAGRGGVWQSGALVSGALSDAARRRRRLDMYRQRHEANVRSYDVWTNAVADGQRQQTAVLFQRWLDSRCKRTTFPKSKIAKGEVITADPNSKSTILKTKRRHTEDGISVYHDEQLRPADEIAECSYDSGSPTLVSKQRKITESSMPALGAPPVYTAASEPPPAAGSCKQEVIGTEVVSSDMDLGCFDDDPSAFLDICRTINGCEFPVEFQKYLSESEIDSSNLNFSSGELMCLSVSDVNDAVAPTAQQSSVDSGPSVQNATFASEAFQPLHSDTKYVNPPFSAPTVPVDNYSVQPWHQSSQLQEPVMQHLQLLLTSVPTQQPDPSELLKYYQVMQTKQRPSLKTQLQSHDTQNLSRIQAVQQQQQLRNELQSYYPADVSAQHLQPYVMTPEQQTWLQPEWQMSAHCTQQTRQQQLYPCQFVPTSVGVCGTSVKKEMPQSVIASSATHTATRPHQQMSSVCSEDNGQALPPQYSNMTVVMPACQSQSRINWQMNC